MVKSHLDPSQRATSFMKLKRWTQFQTTEFLFILTEFNYQAFIMHEIKIICLKISLDETKQAIEAWRKLHRL